MVNTKDNNIKKTFILCLVILMANIANAAKGDVVGFITASSGDNIVSRKGKHLEPMTGMKIYEQDVFITRPESRMQFELRDKSIIGLGVSSKLSIKKFQYDTNQEDEFQKLVLYSELGIFRITSGDISNLNDEGFVIKARNALVVSNDDYVKINIESVKGKPDLVACLKGSIDVTGFDESQSGLQDGEFVEVPLFKTLRDVKSYTQKNMPGAQDYALKDSDIKKTKQALLTDASKVSQIAVSQRYDEELRLYFTPRNTQALEQSGGFTTALQDGYYKLDTLNSGDLFTLKYSINDAKVDDYSFRWNANSEVFSEYVAQDGINQVVTFRGKVIGKMDDGGSLTGQFLFNIDTERNRIDIDSYYAFLAQKTNTYWKVFVTSNNDFKDLEVSDDALSSETTGVWLIRHELEVRGENEQTAKVVGGLFELKDESGNTALTHFGGIANDNDFPRFNKIEQADY